MHQSPDHVEVLGIKSLLTDKYHLVILPNMKMDKKIKARCETRAAILKALAHPTRLFMIEQLAEKSYCVCELTEMVGLDVSTVSKHLSILKNTGLVNVEKKGKQVFYSLRMRCALNFLDCVEAVLREQAQDRMDAIQ
jgi:DNA-binding transcriptional ArsR family regulator